MNRGEDGALLLGRLFVAALFLPSGFGKLMAFSAFSASLVAKGVPYASIVAGLMVAAEFVGPLALIIGLWPRATALALVGFSAVSLWLTFGSSLFGMVLRRAARPP
jgi:putative oxidoreductase